MGHGQYSSRIGNSRISIFYCINVFVLSCAGRSGENRQINKRTLYGKYLPLLNASGSVFCRTNDSNHPMQLWAFSFSNNTAPYSANSPLKIN